MSLLDQKCEACGADLKRAMLFALMIDAGAQTKDPNECPSTDDHEHRWIEVPIVPSDSRR
jgi:hypothetical protein